MTITRLLVTATVEEEVLAALERKQALLLHAQVGGAGGAAQLAAGGWCSCLQPAPVRHAAAGSVPVLARVRCHPPAQAEAAGAAANDDADVPADVDNTAAAGLQVRSCCTAPPCITGAARGAVRPARSAGAAGFLMPPPKLRCNPPACSRWPPKLRCCQPRSWRACWLAWCRAGGGEATASHALLGRTANRRRGAGTRRERRERITVARQHHC